MTSYDFFVFWRSVDVAVRAIFPLVAVLVGAFVLLRGWRVFLANRGTRHDIRGLSRRVATIERRLADLEKKHGEQ